MHVKFGCAGWMVVGLVGVVGGGLLLLNVVRSQATDCRNKVPADLMALDFACTRYADLHAGASPSSLDELFRADAEGRTILRGMRLPLDPWGRAYRYEPAHAGHPLVRIWTLGRDDLPGGEGDDADIGNWMFR